MTSTGRAAAAASILTFLLGVGAAAHIVEQDQAQPSADTAKAAAAADAWLRTVDAERYDESWNAAAALLRASVTKAQWHEHVGAVRTQLGRLRARRLTSAAASASLPGAPRGTYVVLRFEATFGERSAVETVTPMLEADGQWRVAGYFVR